MKKIIVLGHVLPDGDCIGCVMGIAHALADKGYEVYPYLSDKMSRGLKAFIDADTRFRPFSLPQVAGDYDVICVDTATSDRVFGFEEFCSDRKPVLSVDHHITHVDYAEKDKTYQHNSCAEIVAFMLAVRDCLSEMAATYLYIGVIHDTGRFTRADSHTFEAAKILMEHGADIKAAASTMPALSVREFTARNLLLSKAEFHDGGRIASVFFSDKENKGSVIYTDVHAIAGILREIEGVEYAYTVYQTAEGEIKCSLRSDPEKVDVSMIAARYGGGGHKGASGITVSAEDKDPVKLYEELAEF